MRKDDKKRKSDMNKETYERGSLEITQFDNEDVIATSGVNPSSTIPKDQYEGTPFD